MAVIYYPKDQIMYRRDTNSASYESVVLTINPNTILYFDSGSGLNAISASEVPVTSSWAISASYAFNSLSTASVALSLSYPNPIIGVESSSFNPLAVSSGSIAFWMIPLSSSFHDAYGGTSASMYLPMVRRLNDLSEYGNISGSFYLNQTGSACYSRLTNNTKLALSPFQGPNNTHVVLHGEAVNGLPITTNYLKSIAKPYYCFIAGRAMPVTQSQAAVIDGLISSQRMLCTIGSISQLYAGTALVAYDITKDNVWAVWTFVSDGASSAIRINGSQSVAGNSGTQIITGITYGGDYLGNGGGADVLECIWGHSLDTTDMVNIEKYLMNKYGITPQG